MSFNISNSKIISFNTKTDMPQYKLIGSALDHVDSAKYLGVTLQSDCKFDQHILKKVLVAKWQLGMIKRALYWVPKRAKLIAYKARCLPHLEYASAAWVPPSNNHISIMENVQADAVHFISNNKKRTGIGEEMKRLCLEPLDLRRKRRRISLLLKILSKEEQHSTPSAAYEDFLDQPTTSTVQTRFQVTGLLRLMRSNKNGYL